MRKKYDFLLEQKKVFLLYGEISEFQFCVSDKSLIGELIFLILMVDMRKNYLH